MTQQAQKIEAQMTEQAQKNEEQMTELAQKQMTELKNQTANIEKIMEKILKNLEK